MFYDETCSTIQYDILFFTLVAQQVPVGLRDSSRAIRYLSLGLVSYRPKTLRPPACAYREIHIRITYVQWKWLYSNCDTVRTERTSSVRTVGGRLL